MSVYDPERPLPDPLEAASRWAELRTRPRINWCERHQGRWGYNPDCGWSPRGESCPKVERLVLDPAEFDPVSLVDGER